VRLTQYQFRVFKNIDCFMSLHRRYLDKITYRRCCFVIELLQPLQCRCVEFVIHHERDVHEEQQYMCVARTSNNKKYCDAWSLLLLAATVWSFAYLPLGFPIATKWCCDQDVEVMPCEAFTNRTCDRCGSL